MNHVNPKGLLMCCLQCGRDTMAKSGYCASCFIPNFKGGKNRGYKVRDSSVSYEQEDYYQQEGDWTDDKNR